MPRTYATPLVLELAESSHQRTLLLFIYFLVFVSVFLLPWSLWLRIICLIILFAINMYLRERSKTYDRIVWQSGNNWLLITNDESVKAKLLLESLVTFWLVILLFIDANGNRRSIVIWSDSVRADVFRQLRVRLKIEGRKLIAETA